MKKTYEAIISFLKDYQTHTNAHGYVLGISGGKDSTIVAKLLVDAIGKENVLGVLMPNGLQYDLSDSHRVCDFLGINRTEINIDNEYEGFINMCSANMFSLDFKTITRINISDKAKTNIPPRIRMTILYTIAQSLGYRVAGTGNKSEQFIGWFTKWGDGGCDINPIAHLTCTQVVQLGDYLKLPKELIHKTPMDGLTGKSDEENFGFTYQELDCLIEKVERLHKAGYLESPFTENEKKILKMHDSAYHKQRVIKM